MHRISIINSCNDSLNNEIIYLIGIIHEYKGKEKLYRLTSKTIEVLNNNSIINSVIFSNKIEGIVTTKEMYKDIISDKAKLINRSEQEIAGYKDVLKIIMDNYKYMDISTNTILYLHKVLYSKTNISLGGKFKPTDNVIQEEDSDGNKIVRFKPVPSHLTKEYMDNLCSSFNEAISKNVDPLLAIPIFILDFLCIHPFNDGNGRISRLLTILLLYKFGYNISKYISIEEEIDNNKELYYETLKQSSIDWHDTKNNYTYFINYYLNIILSSYIELDMVASINDDKTIDKIETIISNSLIPISKKEISKYLPDISMITIERNLNKLLVDQKIIKINSGKNTKYIINKDK